MSAAESLDALIAAVMPANRFYRDKLQSLTLPARLNELPFTTKAELVADQDCNPPYGSNLTFPVERYTRMHQTSGTTTGQPLRWLDTSESWDWMLGCWRKIFELAGLRSGDRLFFPFSFGPFLGFWTAFEAASQAGYLSLPGGGMSSTARLRFLLDHAVTVVLCTPTYALHLVEVAEAEQIDLPASPARALIVAGEPGGSIPETRRRIESAWGARVFDHYGLTEVGPCAAECEANPGGMHLLTDDYIGEVIDPESAQPVPPDVVGELVVTNLGRVGSPLIRYRTGDLVLIDSKPCPCGRLGIRLAGGILGRADDMIHVRGNNVYPAALENLIRRFADVAEFRVTIDETATLTNVRVELESAPTAAEDIAAQVGRAIRDELQFRAEVVAVPPGTLPRFEMKAKRICHRGHREHRGKQES